MGSCMTRFVAVRHQRRAVAPLFKAPTAVPMGTETILDFMRRMHVHKRRARSLPGGFRINS